MSYLDPTFYFPPIKTQGWWVGRNVKTPATKSNDPSSIPETHTVEEVSKADLSPPHVRHSVSPLSSHAHIKQAGVLVE